MNASIQMATINIIYVPNHRDRHVFGLTFDVMLGDFHWIYDLDFQLPASD